MGTNLGDKSANLSTAIHEVSDQIGQVITKSSIYRTAAWGKEDQDDFLNQVIEVECDLDPHKVLKACLSIEQEMGRIRYEKWGERLIDIDVLYYDDLVIETSSLVIPHPELQNRRFTLIPLVEIAPNFIHVGFNQTNRELLECCKDQLEVLRE